jgi:hypothetical protein
MVDDYKEFQPVSKKDLPIFIKWMDFINLNHVKIRILMRLYFEFRFLSGKSYEHIIFNQ